VKEIFANAIACPVCKGFTTEVYVEGEDQDLESSTIGSSRKSISPGSILRCHTCRFGFRPMRSSPEQLGELYRQMDPEVYELELEGRDRTAQRHLRIVHQYVRAGRLLDVGCASGLFLAHASRAGWEVTGIEPNEKLCEEAGKNLDGKGKVQCATMETARLEGRFDAITLWDVLEHVPDPVRFLLDCCRVLQLNGYLFLNVPDLDSREARILGKRWPLLLPEHLNYFNRQSLQLCAEQATLTPVLFGRRRAWFSLKYLAFRLAQHGILGSRLLQGAAKGPLAQIVVPVSLGETFAVLRAERGGQGDAP